METNNIFLIAALSLSNGARFPCDFSIYVLPTLRAPINRVSCISMVQSKPDHLNKWSTVVFLVEFPIALIWCSLSHRVICCVEWQHCDGLLVDWLVLLWCVMMFKKFECATFNEGNQEPITRDIESQWFRFPIGDWWSYSFINQIKSPFFQTIFSKYENPIRKKIHFRLIAENFLTNENF